MVDFQEIEALLKEVVGGKRLSASKMTKFQEMAMKSLKHDTKLVSMLYRTHKSLPKSQKISSFYVFDALARAAKHQANKHSLAIEERPSDKPGNAGSFLFKLEGILDGLVEDMMTVGTSEANEKTRKVLEIWKKANTFPPDVLSRLLQIVDQGGQGTTAEAASTSTLPITDKTQSQSTESAAPSNDLPPAILALLGPTLSTNGSVANTTLAPAPQPNPAPLEPSQLALLQQLTQKVAAMAPPPAALGTAPALGGRPSIDPQYMTNTPTYVPHSKRYQEEREDPRRPRPRDPPANGGHGGNRYDRPFEHNNDSDTSRRRFGPAGRDRNGASSGSGSGRWDRPPPPRRDQHSRSRSRSPPARTDPRKIPSPTSASVQVPRGQAIPTFTSVETPSRGAQTMQMNTLQGKKEALSSIPSSSSTLATLDVSNFDMTSADSWAKLGAAFKATHGRDGTQEELVATLMALQNGLPPPSFGGSMGGMNMQNAWQETAKGAYANQVPYWSNPAATIGTWETRELDEAKHGGRHVGHGSYDDGIGYAIGPGRWQNSDAVVLTGNDDY